MAERGKGLEEVLRYGLDFDDAYQYALGEKFDLKIVRHDDDFDRTPRGHVIYGRPRPR